MQVRHILGDKGGSVIGIGRQATLAEAAGVLAERRIGALVVRDEGGALAGILSERDLVRAMAADGAGALGFFALSLFVLVAASDWLDGYLARKYGQVTTIGRILDPFVDKVAVCGTYVMLLRVAPVAPLIESWTVVVIVAREFFVNDSRGWFESKGISFGAEAPGKIKMLLQCVSVSLLLAHRADPRLVSSDGESAVDWARKFNNPAVLFHLKLLSAATSASSLPSPSSGRPSAMEAVARSLPIQRATSATVMTSGGCPACHAQPLTTMVIEAARAQGLAEAQKQVDVATFMQWVDAYAQKDDELVAFYFKRFREEFKPAVNAWLATRPLKNADAPLTPFAMPEYQLAAEEDAKRLDAEAEASSALVHRNIQRASDYVLAVVLFAVSLFFAGMSTKLNQEGLRKIAIAVGCVVFLGTAIWIATFPVSIAV